jgi:RNA polymerase sigma factor (sigma-70 family)
VIDLKTKKWCENAYEEHYDSLIDIFNSKYHNLSIDEIFDVIESVFEGVLKFPFNRLSNVKEPVRWLYTRINQRVLNYLRDKEPILSLEENRTAIERLEIKNEENYTIEDVVKMIERIVPLSELEKTLLIQKQSKKSKEIAKNLDLSTTNVDAKYSRILKKVKKQLIPVYQNQYFFIEILDSNIEGM